MLTLQNISKTFGDRLVLSDMSLTIPRGKVVGLIGPNGAGKTTLIRIMNGVISPTHGTVRYDDQPIEALRTKAGIVTESAGLYPDMTALENLTFYASLYDVRNKNHLLELLNQFDLTHVRDAYVHTFSTGMKKRLALAKAMLHDPEILFLDEPTNGLDPDGIRQVLDMIRSVNQTKGTTVIITSHLLYQLEGVCDAYIFIEQGRLIDQGTLADLLKRHQTAIRVRIRTNLPPGSVHTMFETAVAPVAPDVIEVSFKDETCISPFLKQIIDQGYAVYECQIIDRDLEGVYFKLRGETK